MDLSSGSATNCTAGFAGKTLASSDYKNLFKD